jgi:hypothetical protein
MKRTIRSLVVALLLPHLAACAGAATRSASPDRTTKSGPVSTAASTEKGREAAESPAPAAGGSGAVTPTTSAAPDESRKASPEPKEAAVTEMAIDISMKPSCVRRTEKTTMTVKTEKFADISFGLSYSDGQNHGQYGIARTDAKGLFVKSFVVPLDAAVGDVTVLVAGVNAATSHGGSSQGAFEVASSSC